VKSPYVVFGNHLQRKAFRRAPSRLASTFEELNIDSPFLQDHISFEVEESFNIDIPDEALGTMQNRSTWSRA